jgi:hypothetical protein
LFSACPICSVASWFVLEVHVRDLLTLVWCVPLFCVRIVVLLCLSNMVVKCYSSLSCSMSGIYNQTFGSHSWGGNFDSGQRFYKICENDLKDVSAGFTTARCCPRKC